jgi:ribosomal protein S18 acetylase RimI-like enzyme
MRNFEARLSSVAIEGPRDALLSEAESIRLFLSANGWSHRVGAPAQFAALLQASSRTAVVHSGAQVVGFTCGITDGLSNGYLSMVAVAPEFRRCGIGSALVAHITAGPPEVSWVLQAGRPSASEFFAKLGFVVAPLAMQRERKQSVT